MMEDLGKEAERLNLPATQLVGIKLQTYYEQDNTSIHRTPT